MKDNPCQKRQSAKSPQCITFKFVVCILYGAYSNTHKHTLKKNHVTPCFLIFYMPRHFHDVLIQCLRHGDSEEEKCSLTFRKWLKLIK